MFTQTRRPTRRQFLERSALGVGSVLLTPLLLDSCTDHQIPDPGKPIIIPPSESVIFGWKDDAKSIVITGLEMVPDAGVLLSGLADLFWPSSGENVWDQVKNDIEDLVGQKMA